MCVMCSLCHCLLAPSRRVPSFRSSCDILSAISCPPLRRVGLSPSCRPNCLPLSQPPPCPSAPARVRVPRPPGRDLLCSVGVGHRRASCWVPGAGPRGRTSPEAPVPPEPLASCVGRLFSWNHTRNSPPPPPPPWPCQSLAHAGQETSTSIAPEASEVLR